MYASTALLGCTNNYRREEPIDLEHRETPEQLLESVRLQRNIRSGKTRSYVCNNSDYFAPGANVDLSTVSGDELDNMEKYVNWLKERDVFNDQRYLDRSGPPGLKRPLFLIDMMISPSGEFTLQTHNFYVCPKVPLEAEKGDREIELGKFKSLESK